MATSRLIEFWRDPREHLPGVTRLQAELAQDVSHSSRSEYRKTQRGPAQPAARSENAAKNQPQHVQVGKPQIGNVRKLPFHAHHGVSLQTMFSVVQTEQSGGEIRIIAIAPTEILRSSFADHSKRIATTAPEVIEVGVKDRPLLK